MKTEPVTNAGNCPVDGQVRPVAWRIEYAGDEKELYFERRPYGLSQSPLYDQTALDAAVAAERERCARLCIERSFQMTGADEYQTAAACADLIRRA